MQIFRGHYIRSYCDLDLKRQMRKFYTNANMLIRKFFKFSVDVKCYLFKTYCSTMYMVSHRGHNCISSVLTILDSALTS